MSEITSLPAVDYPDQPRFYAASSSPDVCSSPSQEHWGSECSAAAEWTDLAQHSLSIHPPLQPEMLSTYSALKDVGKYINTVHSCEEQADSEALPYGSTDLDRQDEVALPLSRVPYSNGIGAPRFEETVHFRVEHFDYVRFGKHLEQDIANMSDSDMLPWGNAETHKPSVLIPWVEGSPKQFNIPRNITKEGLSRKANEWVKDSIATTRPTKSGWKLGDGPIMIDDIGMRSLRYVSQGSIELELVFLGQVSLC
ncbi:hypothetical protein IEO21_08668 [Rhodonia placenta]|uniref:Uncharacterized protein n=1 Tax=Rhodonia placenta TaxID=104341 RepID=A0A8H7NVP5_9APHY|nr:hypothetical protein IEO21_08668 [Postia placenta]